MTTRFLVACSAFLMCATIALAEGTFQKTKDGKTTVWNDHPKTGDVATWTGGRDRDGYAHGFGTLTWYRQKQEKSVLYALYFGNMVHGKFEGAVNAHSKGKTAHAVFTDGTRTSAWATGPAPSRGLATEKSVARASEAGRRPKAEARSTPSVVSEKEREPSRKQAEQRPTPPPLTAGKAPKPIQPSATATPAATPLASAPPALEATESSTPPPIATTEKTPSEPEATPPAPLPTPSATATAIARNEEPVQRETELQRPTPPPTPTPAATRKPRPAPKPTSTAKPKREVDESLRSLVGPPARLRKDSNEQSGSPVESNPPLSKAEVIDLADTVARTRGYNPGDYEHDAPEYNASDDTWSVSYDQKPGDDTSQAGKHFNVMVDGKTKKATLVPGR